MVRQAGNRPVKFRGHYGPCGQRLWDTSDAHVSETLGDVRMMAGTVESPVGLRVVGRIEMVDPLGRPVPSVV